jgi:hypothetical protein
MLLQTAYLQTGWIDEVEFKGDRSYLNSYYFREKKKVLSSEVFKRIRSAFIIVWLTAGYLIRRFVSFVEFSARVIQDVLTQYLPEKKKDLSSGITPTNVSEIMKNNCSVTKHFFV